MSAAAGRRHREEGAPGGPYSRRLYLRLAQRDIAMLRFLLEAEDNLGYLSVVDRFAAAAALVFAPGSEAAVRRFLDRASGLVPHAVILPRDADDPGPALPCRRRGLTMPSTRPDAPDGQELSEPTP